MKSRTAGPAAGTTPVGGGSSGGGDVTGGRMLLQCAGCDGPILDRFLLNVLDRVWHVKCVQCCDCRCMLTDKCFSRDGQLFCREDFFLRFGTKCGGCGQGISPNDLVRRARQNVYHLKCFTCSICHRQLATGEQLYVVDDSRFICRQDFVNTKLQSGFNDVTEASNDVTHADSKLPDDTFSERDIISPSGLVPPSCFNDDSSGRDSPSHQRQTTIPFPVRSSDWPVGAGGVTPPSCVGDVIDPGLLNDDCSLDSASSCGEDTSGSLGGGANTSNSSSNNNNNNTTDKGKEGVETASAGTAGAKRRGPRTTIKAKQLETLKSAFAATPKPTRHIREQLAQETGLNMRVIQVWFQNRRSKERRMKQLSVMGARRQFFRNPRRLRALRPGEEYTDAVDLLGPGAALGYFTDNCDFYPAYPPPGPPFSEYFHPAAGGPVDHHHGGGLASFLTPTSGGAPPHLSDHLTSPLHDAIFLSSDLLLPGQQHHQQSQQQSGAAPASCPSSSPDIDFSAATTALQAAQFQHQTELQMTEAW